MPVLVYLLLLHFALFSYHFICFFASNGLQISWFTDLLEGVLSYNPPVRKSAFLAFDHFLIEPPPSLQHCIYLPTPLPTLAHNSNRQALLNGRHCLELLEDRPSVNGSLFPPRVISRFTRVRLTEQRTCVTSARAYRLEGACS